MRKSSSYDAIDQEDVPNCPIVSIFGPLLILNLLIYSARTFKRAYTGTRIFLYYEGLRLKKFYVATR